MQNRQEQLLCVIEKKIEGDDRFELECHIKEIEWNVASGLKKYRISLNMSQEDIAKKSGLTRQMVSRVETFSYTPNLTTFIKYLYALGIDFSSLINNLCKS